MSKCISSQGEYSDHTPDAKFCCTRCFAFDEDQALAALEASESNEAKAIRRAGAAEVRRDESRVAAARLRELNRQVRRQRNAANNRADAAERKVARVESGEYTMVRTFDLGHVTNMAARATPLGEHESDALDIVMDAEDEAVARIETAALADEKDVKDGKEQHR